jgi:hypothetical protein
MPLYRAKELLRIAHWSSNASLAASGDPYFKVRSICDIFNENSTRLWYPQERISGDELTQGMWTRFALAKQVRNKRFFMDCKRLLLPITMDTLFACILMGT